MRHVARTPLRAVMVSPTEPTADPPAEEEHAVGGETSATGPLRGDPLVRGVSALVPSNARTTRSEILPLRAFRPVTFATTVLMWTTRR